MAGVGMQRKDMEKSPFVEKLIARGYEVLYFPDPLDEMFVEKLKTYRELDFQDVAKKGIRFGDEDEEADKKETAELEEEFNTLTEWMKPILEEWVNNIIVSVRLTTSPSAVTVDNYAWTGNMERLMAAQSGGRENKDDFMTQIMRTSKKTFEINPHHPLIQAMLDMAKRLPSSEDQETDTQILKEVVLTLWDTSSVRSGYPIKDMDVYFSRVETLLRRSVGVSQSAKVDIEDLDIKPAPELETELPAPVVSDSDDLSSYAIEHPDDWDERWTDEETKVKWSEYQDHKAKLMKPKIKLMDTPGSDSSEGSNFAYLRDDVRAEMEKKAGKEEEPVSHDEL